ncbi:MAG: alpha/beta hydrolase, partial [Lacisediminimonas sp.]|nr:alpha/beta hydrolase [Lacisediminimonas sp.]
MSQQVTVFLSYTQAELDAAYDQTVWAPNMEQVSLRFVRASVRTRSRLGGPRRLAYGPTDIEHIDFFPARGASGPAPLVIYVHGGAWHARSVRNYEFLAEPFVNAGAHFAALEFISVDDTGGDLFPMAAQVRAAIAWLARNAQELRVDPGRIHLSGHSSGAHLAAVALTTDWTGEYGLAADLLTSAVLVSGLYDMQPVRLSARGDYVHFTDQMEQVMSSQRHLHRIVTPAIVVHGTEESPEFQRQSREFAQALA